MSVVVGLVSTRERVGAAVPFGGSHQWSAASKICVDDYVEVACKFVSAYVVSGVLGYERMVPRSVVVLVVAFDPFVLDRLGGFTLGVCLVNFLLK